jgi:calcineurin-like phosphoesterase family protein
MRIAAFYSDPHFYHENVISYSKRPFASADQMNEELIRLYNERIGKSDVVLWLGDCFFCSAEKGARILIRLNGVKVLVRGNHDRPAAAMARMGFAVVADQLTLSISGKKVLASHYPYPGVQSAEDLREPGKQIVDKFDRPVRHKDQILLHGHTHSSERYLDGMVHCGVDAWDYRPAMYEEVESFIKDK